jgi:hypothetical protein
METVLPVLRLQVAARVIPTNNNSYAELALQNTTRTKIRVPETVFANRSIN